MTAPLEVHAFRVAMTMRFRRVEHRDGMLVRGEHGWGEFSPFGDYGPEYASRWLRAALEAATTPAPPAVRDEIPVNTTVPAVAPERAYGLVRASGCATAKVKVAEPGQDLAADVERVAAVRDALGAAGNVRIDANGAWDLATASLAIRRLQRAAAGLEYAEQPCESLDELADLRRRVDVPIALDESVRTGDDPLRAARMAAADLIVVKVQPLGGLTRVLEVVERAGLPAVVSSAIETSVGLATGVALASALPDLRHACGLGTATLLADDVTDEPLVPVDGRIAVRRVTPSVERLAAVRMSGDAEADLLARFDAAAAHLDDEWRGVAASRTLGGR